MKKLFNLYLLAAALLIPQSVHADPYNVVTQGGAACDGITDDTAAFNAAIKTTQAIPNTPQTILVPWTGNGCVVSSLNLTNIPYGFRIIGESAPMRGRSSWLICSEPANDTGTCLDTTGSQAWSIENLGIVDAAGHSPHVMLLMAKSDQPVLGNSQAITLRADFFSNWGGSYVVYNDGGEVDHVDNNQFYGGTAAQIYFTASNGAGIVSSFANIKTGPSSMTSSRWRDNVYSCTSASNDGHCIFIDTSIASVQDLTLDGDYANVTTPGFIDSAGSFPILNLVVANIRDEAQIKSPYFARFNSPVEGYEFSNLNLATLSGAKPQNPIVFRSKHTQWSIAGME
ncbi:MAG TPA: hypothetical protein VMF50_17405 [Candidatus Binataceae bacterium]|nr:hypothetical protein [Candidatus Binataceae bacterium]